MITHIPHYNNDMYYHCSELEAFLGDEPTANNKDISDVQLRSCVYDLKWKVSVDGEVLDIAYDTHKLNVWVFIKPKSGLEPKCLYKIKTDGTYMTKLKCAIAKEVSGLCYDTIRDTLIVTHGKLISHVDIHGGHVQMAKIEDSADLSGIVHCPAKDVYAVCDVRVCCIILLDAQSGRVKDRICIREQVSEMPLELSNLYHRDIDGECEFYVIKKKEKYIAEVVWSGDINDKLTLKSIYKRDHIISGIAIWDNHLYLCDSEDQHIVKCDLHAENRHWSTAIGRDKLARSPTSMSIINHDNILIGLSRGDSNNGILTCFESITQ